MVVLSEHRFFNVVITAKLIAVHVKLVLHAFTPCCIV